MLQSNMTSYLSVTAEARAFCSASLAAFLVLGVFRCFCFPVRCAYGPYRFREVNGHAGETVISEMCYQIAYMLIAWASSILSTTVSSSSTSPRS